MTRLQASHISNSNPSVQATEQFTEVLNHGTDMSDVHNLKTGAVSGLGEDLNVKCDARLECSQDMFSKEFNGSHIYVYSSNVGEEIQDISTTSVVDRTTFPSGGDGENAECDIASLLGSGSLMDDGGDLTAGMFSPASVAEGSPCSGITETQMEISNGAVIAKQGDMYRDLENRKTLFVPTSEGGGGLANEQSSELKIGRNKDDHLQSSLLGRKASSISCTKDSKSYKVFDFNVEPSPSELTPKMKKRNRQKLYDTAAVIPAKIHKSSSNGEVCEVAVGKTVGEFLENHSKIQGIYLNKGKRHIKKDLVKLCRHEYAVDWSSWYRGSNIHERNRLDDSFELTDVGEKKKSFIDAKKTRDEYAVNWYMWCPGRGNCQRKCGGVGQCVQGTVHVHDIV